MHRINPGGPITILLLMFFSTGAFAELAYIDPITSQSVLDQVISKFDGKVKSWQNVIQGAAERLFWSLVLISMVWTFGMMLLRKADLGDFFAEFTRFIIFTGFYFWFLTNAVSGQNIAGTIIDSMQVLGNQASGLTGTSHESIMEIGYLIWVQAIQNLTVWNPVDAFIAIILSLIILVILAVIAVNMLLLLISSWVLLYAGIFFLGFGGSRWTSDIAINYFKTVLGIGIQLLVMILIVGIGNDLLSGFYLKMGQNMMNFEELGVMLIFAVAFFVLISKLPLLLASIITGSSIGSAAGIGSYGGGVIVGAGSVAIAAATMGGSMVAQGTTGAVRGIEALQAAVKAGEGSDIANTIAKSSTSNISKPFSGSNNISAGK